MSFDIIDTSSWEDARIRGKGTHEKLILIEPETRRYVMFRYPATGAGDAWAEKLAIS